MNLLIPLFSPTTGTWGGLTRVIAVANAARQAGHQVAFCASGSLETALRRRGFPVYSMPAPTLFGLPKPLSDRLASRSQNAVPPVRPGVDFGSIWLVLALAGMGSAAYLRRLLQAEIAAARDFQATAVFTDLDPAAFVLARLLRLPIAAAYQSPMRHGTGSFWYRQMDRAARRVQVENQLPALPIGELCHGPRVLKIIPSIPELEDTDPNLPDVRYVGPLLGEIQGQSSFQPKPGKRYVFVYLGTGSVGLDRARQVLPQVFPANGPLVCLVGAQSVTQVERLGAVEFRPFVPATEVLPHCDWTICHGGQNTIMQSLAYGVPLMIFPGPIFERRYNARQVQRRGAGVMGELPDFTPERIYRILSQQAALAEGARHLQTSIQRSGGAPAALAAIEQWAASAQTL